ncbi:MAG: hypothetical protein H6631_18410 [Anaerolineaceae bacterium]|nr:hypothetical protein [Anaerolineaceae bacterium]MCB9101555.1 hypothetical protein [Anaerolineales bacterium]
MQMTLDVPEELVARLSALEDRLPQILELGLREFDASEQFTFEGAAEILEFLARLPTPEEIVALRPSSKLQERISILLEKNRSEGLTPAEEKEWDQYQYLEHLVRIAKAEAHLRLNSA